MELALTDLFQAKWTDEIHREWIYNLIKNRPDLDIIRLTRTKELIDSCVRDCLVNGYEHLIPGLELPDPNDRHVLAAAITARADVIVTFNVKDFPDASLVRYRIEAQHPDEFCRNLIDLEPGIVCEAIKSVRHRLKNPPKTVQEYLEILERQQLTKFANRLRGFAALL